jgi:hypothetical protein
MTALAADSEQIERFVGVIFRHAEPDTYVSLRAFSHGPTPSSARIRAIRLVDRSALVHEATRLATVAANHLDPIVVAPPVCTFRTVTSAAEGNVANGVCISVELDEHPYDSAAYLEDLLGPPTIAIASGGTWTADSDSFRPGIPRRCRPPFRADVGRSSKMKPATIPI